MPELATVKQHPTLNETVSLQNISERLKSLSTKPGCQNLSESTGLRRHITGKFTLQSPKLYNSKYDHCQTFV